MQILVKDIYFKNKKIMMIPLEKQISNKNKKLITLKKNPSTHRNKI